MDSRRTDLEKTQVWLGNITMPDNYEEEHKKYIFPTTLEQILLKSKNLKYFTTTPKVHSTETFTSFIDLF